jgi:hypothetical protein
LSAVTTNTGTLNVDSSGYIRSGQTAFNTGIGFFLGNSGGVPKFSIGNPSGNYLAWDGTNLIIRTSQSNVTITGVQSATYSDDGFAVYPASTSVTAYVVFDTNGQAYGGSAGYQTNWYAPNTTSIGNSYWIKFTALASSGTSTESATLNTWLQLNSSRSVQITRTATGSASKSYVFQISSNSAGTAIVGSGTIALSVMLDI